ncbi:MAG: hypothetical protein PHD05_00410 [Sphaerochaetaceae bacterium]|nr:hypothetical protein [Sphaerochaetaceae bacterium]
MNRTTVVRRSKKITNPEGYSTYKRRKDQALLFTACSFTPRNSFYLTEDERLKQLEYLIDSLIKNNEVEYITALTWMLGKILGIRLAPSIITTKLAGICPDKHLEKIINDVFTRPDFMANSLAYWKRTHGTIKTFPRSLFKFMKLKFETFNDNTLKNRKMRYREFKLKDLIKIFKPIPIDKHRSKLYKAIIEDSKLSKLQVKVDESGKIVKADHITAAISDRSIDYDNKKQFVSESISTIPINALIKNLSFLSKSDVTPLYNRLKSIFESEDSLRFINPFDLIFMQGQFAENVNIAPEIVKVCDSILTKFALFNCKCENPVILYDKSGSMSEGGHYIGSKFLSLFVNIFTKKFKFYEFDIRLFDNTNKILDFATLSPNILANNLYSKITCDGCTALLDSIKAVIDQNPQMDLFVIVTDEVTWADTQVIEEYRRIIPSHLSGKVILVNVSPTLGSVFKVDDKIVRISGLDGKIIKLIEAITDFDKFKKYIIQQFNT